MTQERCFIQELKLKNYRCFPELFLSFHDRLTVLVAPNGGGKTAVLDGIAIALRLFVDTMEGRQSSKSFETKDIRLVLNPNQKMEPVTPVRLEASGLFLGSEITWSRERQSRKRTSNARNLKMLASRLTQENQDWAEGKTQKSPLFPLIAYYGTGRLWGDISTKTGESPQTAPNARYRGYADCLSSASHYKEFVNWFRRFSYEAKQENSPHKPQRSLGVVRQAVNLALKPVGWHTLEWDFAEDVIVAHHEMYGRLLVDTLSDGIRTMIGLVADIAHRAVLLNPQLDEKAAAETPGIVLIDEVDMHLHPAWQQMVLPALQQAFPLVQFIVTTHSPQVITTVPQECIRIFKEGGVYSASPGTDGAEAQRILEDVFQVSPRPKTSMADALDEYLRLVNNRQWASPRALELRQQLDEWSQGYEPRLIEADLQIDNMKWEAGE